MAQGFSQIYGADYHETFASLVRLSLVRLLLSVATVEDWKILHYHVNFAFRQGLLHETEDVKQPKGFFKPGNEKKVCKLLQPIYRLKQEGYE